MINTLTFNRERMLQATESGYPLATDLADYLVKQDLPFRQAHKVIVDLVRYAEHQGKRFDQLELQEYQSFSPLFGSDVFKITLNSALESRNVLGGTAPTQVKNALQIAWKDLGTPGGGVHPSSSRP